jgi:LPS sulfotransferase NodH
MLCRALADTGVAGRAEEYFLNWSGTSADLADIFDLGTTDNGVFSTKLMWNYFAETLAKLRALPEFAGLSRPALISAVFPNPVVVHLIRRDELRQAVSWARAALDGVWIDADDAPAEAASEPAFDATLIGNLVRLVRQGREGWRTVVAELDRPSREVVYEDFASESGYEPTLRAIIEQFDLTDDASTIAIAPPRTRRQADGLNDTWVARYLAERGS